MYMQYSNEAGLRLSRIGIGCWAFGGGEYWGRQDQKDADAVVHAAIEKGINVFDTARMYNNGESEISLGKALRGKREKTFIISKVSPAKAYYKTLKEECEISLKNLGTDHIDLYMMHWPINPLGIKHFIGDSEIIANPPSTGEAFAALAELKKEGKILHIGVSNYGVKQLDEARQFCTNIAANELPYNVISRAIETKIIPYCARKKIAVISSMTYQQGVLTGKYKKAGDIPPNQAHSRHFRQERGKGTSRHFEDGAEEEIFNTVGILHEIADELGISMAQLAAAWVLANSKIACALIGCRNTKQLDENIGAADLKLSISIMRKINDSGDTVLKKMGDNPDYYENSKDSRIY